MDPTTKAGRAELREEKAASDGATSARGCPHRFTPRWQDIAADALPVALSHIDKLEAERDEAERLHDAACAEKFQLAKQCDSLRAELEQAREALQKIARDQPNDAYWWKHPRVENAEYMVDAWREVCNLMSECARAALANPSETPNSSPAPYEPSEMESDAPYLRAIVIFGAKIDEERVLRIAANHDALIAAHNARRKP